MPDFLGLMQLAALNAVEQSKPVEITFGTVTKKNPLSIRLGQKLVLSEDFFVFTNTAHSFEEGEKLVLLRFQGGQKYLILDKVMDYAADV